MHRVSTSTSNRPVQTEPNKQQPEYKPFGFKDSTIKHQAPPPKEEQASSGFLAGIRNFFTTKKPAPPPAPKTQEDTTYRRLVLAIHSGQTELAKALIDKIGIDSIAKQDQPAVLIWAIDNQQTELRNALIKKISTDPIQTHDLLMKAINKGPTELVKALIEKISIDSIPKEDQHAVLRWAINNQQTELAQALIDKIGLDSIPKEDQHAVLRWAINNQQTELRNALIEKISTDPIQTHDLLMKAINKGHTKLVKALIEKISIDSIPKHDQSNVLIWAINNQQTELAKALIEKMDVGQISLLNHYYYNYYNNSASAFLSAVSNRQMEIAKAIVNRFVSIGTLEAFKVLGEDTSRLTENYNQVYSCVTQIDSMIDKAIALKKKIPGVLLLENAIEDYFVKKIEEDPYTVIDPKTLQYLQENPQCVYLTATVFKYAVNTTVLSKDSEDSKKSEDDARLLAKNTSQYLNIKEMPARALEVSHFYLADYLNRIGKKQEAFNLLMEGFDIAFLLGKEQSANPNPKDYQLYSNPEIGENRLLFGFLGLANSIFPETDKQKPEYNKAARDKIERIMALYEHLTEGNDLPPGIVTPRWEEILPTNKSVTYTMSPKRITRPTWKEISNWFLK